MPHPFFDARIFPWSRSEARELYRVLGTTIVAPATIDRLHRACAPNLAPLAMLGVPPDQIWKAALEALAIAGALKTLCDLLLLEAEAETMRPAIVAVQQLPDPVEQPIIGGDEIVFLDRQPLRDKVQRFAKSTTFRVLLIRGDADSGKSWTQHIVASAAESLGEKCVYLFEGLVSTVEEVLEQLFVTLDKNAVVPARLETEEAWFKKVCVRLGKLGEESKRTSWVVIDDLGEDAQGPRLDPSIRQFCDQFALSMANPAFRQWFRLVLIDYPHLRSGASGRGVPTKWKDFWDEDRPSAADIQDSHIAAFVTKWAALKHKQIDTQGAAAFARDVIATADAATTPLPRLERIHGTLRDKLASL